MSEAFRAARDFLLENRTDYDVAYRGFRWPNLDRFNWALDWFDSIAAGERSDQIALWVMFEDGTETKLSFRELSSRSSRLANYYRELGVHRGDRVMVMLGNTPPLWETVLALIKLGGVILPATPLLRGDDLADRIERGHVRHIVCSADCASRFGHLEKRCTRIVVGGQAPGFHAYEEGYDAPAKFEPDGETRASDPMQLYFRRCTGLGCGLATYTAMSRLQVGRSMPGAAFSRPGMPRQRFLSQISHASMRRGCWRQSPARM